MPGTGSGPGPRTALLRNLEFIGFFDIFQFVFDPRRFFYYIHASKNKLQTEAVILHPLLPKTPCKTASKYNKMCIFQFFKNPPIFSIISPFLPPIPPPPKSISQPGISFSGPDSSKYSALYQKVSKSPPHQIFPRFTNKKPDFGL